MRRLMRELEARRVQRGVAKQTIIFDRASLKSDEHALWVKATAWVMSVVMYLSPMVFLAEQTAHAAPIVDPRAPITFQPSVTQTSAGVPAINIPGANANGISVGQRWPRSFGQFSEIFKWSVRGNHAADLIAGSVAKYASSGV
ncbi:hypothetical protein [Burkholderia cepacia]|uniref:hypothetical protein n=1 Tax=Burkholderia cepacia TaxID=292 RepID=UPI002AB7A417|nr:hypothetical protein [Burkholderia cepacia]